jgi:citrate lyase subunit beta/citryl-CoA lyase
MIETPRSIVEAFAIASASERLGALVLGTSDLIKEMRARHTRGRENLAYALQSCVTAARAAGIDALDGVHLDFRDLDALRDACVAARDMGFDGKTLIHPSQVDVANEVFGIDEGDVERARSVIEAWREAQSRGSGVAELDGRLIENLHAAEAERTLEFARAIEARKEQAR